MTLEDLEESCLRAEEQMGRYVDGRDPFIVLTLRRTRLPTNTERVRLLPGVMAEVMDTMREADGSFRLVVRAKVADVRRFIERERVRLP
jgi:rRNA pseudouridine-1189 N-methylase Emg1 (Nep1/Mra1 family)